MFRAIELARTVEALGLETFWSIDSYATVNKPDRILMAKDVKQVYDILEKRICFKNGHMSLCYGRIPIYI